MTTIDRSRLSTVSEALSFSADQPVYVSTEVDTGLVGNQDRYQRGVPASFKSNPREICCTKILS